MSVFPTNCPVADRSFGLRDSLTISGFASDVVADGSTAWIVCHRDQTLWHLNLDSGATTRLGSLPGDAPERMVRVAGSLWITGRGTDLLRVDPTTGAVQLTIDVGAGAIDLESIGGNLLVFVPTAADDRQGLPRVAHVLRVDASSRRSVGELPVTRPLMLTGLASDGAHVWLSDTVNGQLVRFG